MYQSHYVTALILAAGMGRRMNAGKNKLLLEISGKSVLSHTVSLFEENPFVDEIIIAAAKDELEEVRKISLPEAKYKPLKVIQGGRDRQESSYFAVKASPDGILLIHDGARAFTDEKIINDVIENTEKYGAAAPGIKVTDTVKKAVGGMIEKTVDREGLFLIQTPQGFIKDKILRAHEKAREENVRVTDDTMLLELTGDPVKITEGLKDNIKITVKEDILLAQSIIRKREIGNENRLRI